MSVSPGKGDGAGVVATIETGVVRVTANSSSALAPGPSSSFDDKLVARHQRARKRAAHRQLEALAQHHRRDQRRGQHRDTHEEGILL